MQHNLLCSSFAVPRFGDKKGSERGTAAEMTHSIVWYIAYLFLVYSITWDVAIGECVLRPAIDFVMLAFLTDDRSAA